MPRLARRCVNWYGYSPTPRDSVPYETPSSAHGALSTFEEDVSCNTVPAQSVHNGKWRKWKAALPPVGSSERRRRSVQSLAPLADDTLLVATARDAPCKQCISSTAVWTRHIVVSNSMPCPWYAVPLTIQNASWTLDEETGRRKALPS